MCGLWRCVCLLYQAHDLAKKYFVDIFHSFEISFRIKTEVNAVQDPPRFQTITELGTFMILGLLESC